MNRFLYHTSCDRCGSSDARAVYSAGDSFCFSCRKPTSSKVSGYVVLPSRESEEGELSIQLPPDATTNYSQGAVEWASRYEITVPQLLQEGVVYSPSKNQLIFTWFSPTGSLLAYQARNLSATNKSKRYYTKGDVNELLPIYSSGNGSSDSGCGLVRGLVLVEDCLSAIKIASLRFDWTSERALALDAMPCLGSSIPRTKLTRLRYLYDRLIIFLDPDMWHKAIGLSTTAQLLGFEVRAIKADKDPKEFSYFELKEMLK